MYIRRENLKISGIPEDSNEITQSTHKKVRKVFAEKLGIAESENIEFQRCHRLGGRPHTGKNRDVIIRFSRYQDRMSVWNSRGKLKGTKLFINEDLPPEIEDKRRKLYLVFKQARRLQKKVSLTADRLTIDGTHYTVNDLDSLPAELKLKNLATRETEDTILFYGSNSCYSNFYPTKFELDGKTFVSSEQYYQYQLAIFCGNNEFASKILATDDPLLQHRLGRKMKPAPDQWDIARAEQIMEAGVKAKFRQNEELKTELLSTSSKAFVECNVYDRLIGNRP